MKKTSNKPSGEASVTDPDEILPEYDFRGASRSPYTKRLSGSAIRIVLDPDVAEMFPTSEHVNRALRAAAKTNGDPTGHRRKTSKG